MLINFRINATKRFDPQEAVRSELGRRLLDLDGHQLDLLRRLESGLAARLAHAPLLLILPREQNRQPKP